MTREQHTLLSRFQGAHGTLLALHVWYEWLHGHR
jgi:hypothetical protein